MRTHAISKLCIVIASSHSAGVVCILTYGLPVFQDTWQEMEKLVDDGLVKSIGISNFSCKKIDTLLEYARIKPVAVQVEVHLYFRNQKLMDHCKAKVGAQDLVRSLHACCPCVVLGVCMLAEKHIAKSQATVR